jgi:hypothetical protein
MKILKRGIEVVYRMGLSRTLARTGFFPLGGLLHVSDFFPVYSL